MPHFLIKVKYTAAAVQGMIANPHDRARAAAAAIEAVGGKLHCFYMAFGPDDVVAIFEAPDAAAGAAVSMAVGASGAMSSVETVPLLTVDEGMSALKKAPTVLAAYKSPSG